MLKKLLLVGLFVLITSVSYAQNNYDRDVRNLDNLGLDNDPPAQESDYQRTQGSLTESDQQYVPLYRQTQSSITDD